MKARLPKNYKQQLAEQQSRDFSLRIIRHVCKGLMVVMYKKYDWRKKRCYELLTELIKYLNEDYDEKEAEEILQQLDLPEISDSTEIK
jgi:hypothetical protein